MFGINFLRNLFTSHTEKQKSEAAMTSFGIFIRSTQSEVAIIDKCRELLQSFQTDSKILHVIRDRVHKGLKVFFNSGSCINELLKKKFLSEENESSTIHSLTTAFSVHEAFPNNEEEFKETIRKQIGNLISTQVMDIKKVPFDSKYPEIGSGKWIIVLDIPEIDDLDEFKTMGLPNTMVLKFPTNNDPLRVKFYCRLCQKDGHVESRCLNSDTTPHSSTAIHSSSNHPRSNESIHKFQRTGLFSKKTSQLPETSNPGTSSADPPLPKNMNPKNKASPSPKPSPITVPTGFRIRDRAEEMAESKIPKPILFPRDMDEFAREIGREEVRRSLIPDSIKKENGDHISRPPNRPNINNENESCRPGGSNENLLQMNADERFAGSYQHSSDTASSTTAGKDSLEIVFESIPRPGIQSPPENSPVVTTTNQRPVKRELSSTDDEDSNNTTTTPPPPKKKTMQLLPVVIPDRIRDIISGMQPGAVLDVGQLEAFFNHVKKKSRPSDFAESYTRDVEGLHSQLVAINRLYYMSPNVGSKADVQFMKMLGNVLKRFYNTPAQRRATRQ